MAAEQVAVQTEPIVGHRPETARAAPHVFPDGGAGVGWPWLASSLPASELAGLSSWRRERSIPELRRAEAIPDRAAWSQRSRSSSPSAGEWNEPPASPEPSAPSSTPSCTTKVSGFVKTLNVDRGSMVKKGDVLVGDLRPGAGRGRSAGRVGLGAFEGRGRAGPRRPS